MENKTTALWQIDVWLIFLPNDDIGDLSQFYDEMTEAEILQHKTKIGLSKIFQCLNPTQKLNFQNVFDK